MKTKEQLDAEFSHRPSMSRLEIIAEIQSDARAELEQENKLLTSQLAELCKANSELGDATTQAIVRQQELEQENRVLQERAEKAEAERDEALAAIPTALNKDEATRVLLHGTQELQLQRDQALTLLHGGTLTEEEVEKSGLGRGVLIEDRHHEAMRCKAEAKAQKAESQLTHVLTSMEEGTLPWWQKKHDDLLAKWFKAEAACVEMREVLLGIRYRENCMEIPAMSVIEHARSSDCGQPLLSRLKAMEEILDGLMCQKFTRKLGWPCDCDACRWKKLKESK